MSRRKFDQAGHPCEPTNLNKKFWFYVQKEGLVLCSYTNGNPTEVATMPWSLVKRAIADHEKAKDRRPTEEAGGRT